MLGGERFAQLAVVDLASGRVEQFLLGSGDRAELILGLPLPFDAGRVLPPQPLAPLFQDRLANAVAVGTLLDGQELVVVDRFRCGHVSSPPGAGVGRWPG